VISERLTYRPIGVDDVDAFHALVRDDHVRRYMMDGNLFPREWSEGHVHKSQALFASRGVGLWLAHDKRTQELIGFCGFLVLPEVHDVPELVYALPGRFTGRGLATEMARAVIAEARRHAGFDEILASVDDVNVASLRVLQKLGFEPTGTQPGAFGTMRLMHLVGPAQ
jgi:RimJ/RimL family protein N-acetyltransferase